MLLVEFGWVVMLYVFVDVGLFVVVFCFVF